MRCSHNETRAHVSSRSGRLRWLDCSGNYSVTGFELTLRRKMAFYIITYYFPTGMFVIVSWISFLVPPESVPGRMTILVTVFLCLVNIFNSITSKIPKADGLTAIEAFIIICIIFVFGALMGKYKFIKIETNNSQLSNDTAEG